MSRRVERDAVTGRQPPGFLCAGAAVGGAPITGIGSPAGELLPMIALILLFVAAGVWMFRRHRPAPAPEPEAGRAGLPVPAPPAREPVPA